MVVKTKSKTEHRSKSKTAKIESVVGNQPKNVKSKKSKAADQLKTKTKSKTEKSDVSQVRVVNKISPPTTPSERKLARGSRVPQYAFMKAPGLAHDFQVGDNVEVYCDHEKDKDRVRGWLGGVVVQVDNKMVAVQFRSNVFLTDGWMVPDRILWYPLNSVHIRPVVGKKSARRDVKFIPEY